MSDASYTQVTDKLDLIDRQAAIDIVEFECGEWSGLARTIVKAIKQLPSAQPEERTKERAETHACDCISRQAAVDAPVKMVSEGLDWIPVYHLKDLPSAEPERKKGKWIDVCDGYADYVKCDQCGGMLDCRKNFCPNCGADMRGEEE